MRRKLTRALARVARRAVLAATGGLAIALTVGVGGLVWAAPTSTLEAAAATQPAPVPLERSTPAALAAALAPPNLEAAPALTVIPVREQALATSRVEPAPAANATTRPATAQAETSGVVRAAAVTRNLSPGLSTGDRLTASLSFYYCEVGSGAAGGGDGGGFCGAMRDGSVVHPGAAACDATYLGQRFRIEGDPLGQIYRCADTGSAVYGQHRDIWFHSSDEGWAWQLVVGRRATIEILP